MNLDNIIKKIDEGEKLTEEEIADLLYEANFIEDDCNDELDRWTRTVVSIVEYKGRYFEIVWDQGLTEYQENSYDEQPVEIFDDGIEEVIVKRRKWKYTKD